LFYESCEPLIQKTLQATEAAVQAVMGENSAALACIYLVGGSCELPLLARSLRERFGKKVRRSPYPSAATAIGLAISAAHCSDYRLEERFHRYFGVWRESESGTSVMFDPIFSKGTPLPAQGQKPIAVKRCYQPAHNIGHFRFIECSQLANSREPRGDIVAWDQILFPFDPAVAAESDLRRVEVLRWSEGSRHEVEEVYQCDSRGIIEVAIADHTSGIRRSYRLRGAIPEKALAEPG
jgi:molecular chaperone DnaK (HSP70)